MCCEEGQQWRREGLLVLMGAIREDFTKEVTFNPNLKVRAALVHTEGLAQANAWRGEQVEGLSG